jgi:hypothetical protein
MAFEFAEVAQDWSFGRVPAASEWSLLPPVQQSRLSRGETAMYMTAFGNGGGGATKFNVLVDDTENSGLILWQSRQGLRLVTRTKRVQTVVLTLTVTLVDGDMLEYRGTTMAGDTVFHYDYPTWPCHGPLTALKLKQNAMVELYCRGLIPDDLPLQGVCFVTSTGRAIQDSAVLVQAPSFPGPGHRLLEKTNARGEDAVRKLE